MAWHGVFICALFWNRDGIYKYQYLDSPYYIHSSFMITKYKYLLVRRNLPVLRRKKAPNIYLGTQAHAQCSKKMKKKIDRLMACKRQSCAHSWSTFPGAFFCFEEVHVVLYFFM